MTLFIISAAIPFLSWGIVNADKVAKFIKEKVNG